MKAKRIHGSKPKPAKPYGEFPFRVQRTRTLEALLQRKTLRVLDETHHSGVDYLETE